MVSPDIVCLRTHGVWHHANPQCLRRGSPAGSAVTCSRLSLLKKQKARTALPHTPSSPQCQVPRPCRFLAAPVRSRNTRTMPGRCCPDKSSSRGLAAAPVWSIWPCFIGLVGGRSWGVTVDRWRTLGYKWQGGRSRLVRRLAQLLVLSGVHPLSCRGQSFRNCRPSSFLVCILSFKLLLFASVCSFVVLLKPKISLILYHNLAIAGCFDSTARLFC